MSRLLGKYRDVVVRIDDPEQLGRVQVLGPAVLGEERSNWAQPSVPYTAPGLGLFRVPPEGTSVWVEFEGGDSQLPIYSGCLRSPGEEPLLAAADRGPVTMSHLLEALRRERAKHGETVDPEDT